MRNTMRNTYCLWMGIMVEEEGEKEEEEEEEEEEENEDDSQQLTQGPLTYVVDYDRRSNLQFQFIGKIQADRSVIVRASCYSHEHSFIMRSICRPSTNFAAPEGQQLETIVNKPLLLFLLIVLHHLSGSLCSPRSSSD